MPTRNKLKAVLVGVGPGASTLVTPEAREIISRAEIILGWDMDLLPVRDCVAGKKIFLQDVRNRSEEHTSELQSQSNLVCRLLLEKKSRSKPGREESRPRSRCAEVHG